MCRKGPCALTNWDLAGKARSKCVTDVGHKVQLPLGPSSSDASANWNLAGWREAPLAPPLGELARRIEAMSDAHRLTWWNLL